MTCEFWDSPEIPGVITFFQLNLPRQSKVQGHYAHGQRISIGQRQVLLATTMNEKAVKRRRIAYARVRVKDWAGQAKRPVNTHCSSISTVYVREARIVSHAVACNCDPGQESPSPQGSGRWPPGLE
jgi:hypothetical protein